MTFPELPVRSVFALGALAVGCAAPSASVSVDATDPRASPPPVPPLERNAQEEGEEVEEPVEARSDEPRLDLGIGVGLTEDPDSFLIGIEGSAGLANNLYVGPVLQIGISDNDAILAPSINLGRRFPLDTTGTLAGLEFAADAGIGWAYLEDERIPGDDDDSGILFNLGLGADLPVDGDVRVGTSIRFNFLPSEVLDEEFFFSWQILRVVL